MTYSRGKYPRNYSFKQLPLSPLGFLRIVSYDKRRKRTRRTAMKRTITCLLAKPDGFFLCRKCKRCLYSERYCREVFSQEKHDQSLFESANGRRSFSENCDPTRLFFHKQAFESQNYPLTQNVYESLAAVAAEKPFLIKRRFLFQCDRQQRQSGRSH